MGRTASTLLLALLAFPASAQSTGNLEPATHQKPVTNQQSPYSGMGKRVVKALSEEQIAELEAGSGMGLALAAELNSYPGPVHVLELADALALSHEQRSRTKNLMEAMKAEAIPIGREIITLERELDAFFAERKITHEAIDEVTARIATAQGNLRAVHLRFHIDMVAVLSSEQVLQYGELRGYSGHPRL